MGKAPLGAAAALPNQIKTLLGDSSRHLHPQEEVAGGEAGGEKPYSMCPSACDRRTRCGPVALQAAGPDLDLGGIVRV
ncbi:MAG: hypothetical protein IPN71_13110 [Fibrobacteres bacterium]|nr:hypothetical protein [Fibrobacterota bacterium]